MCRALELVRVRETSARGVQTDEPLPDDEPVGERDGADVAVELGGGHETWHQPRVELAEVGDGVPDGAGLRIEGKLLDDRGHGALLRMESDPLIVGPPLGGESTPVSPG